MDSDGNILNGIPDLSNKFYFQKNDLEIPVLSLNHEYQGYLKWVGKKKPKNKPKS